MKRERTYYTENPIIKEELRKYLKENGINPYISGCFNGWYFQMELTEEEAEKTEWFLESIIEG